MNIFQWFKSKNELIADNKNLLALFGRECSRADNLADQYYKLVDLHTKLETENVMLRKTITKLHYKNEGLK